MKDDRTGERRCGGAPGTDESPERPFWETTPLERMTRAQWESLCDGCGKCCLHKLEDIDTGEIFLTNVACRLLDHNRMRCRKYAERKRWVPDCTILTPERIAEFRWLPESCAYRRIHEGRGLADWHPLVSGDPMSVHRAGISMRRKVIDERKAGPLEDHIIADPSPTGHES